MFAYACTEVLHYIHCILLESILLVKHTCVLNIIKWIGTLIFPVEAPWLISCLHGISLEEETRK